MVQKIMLRIPVIKSITAPTMRIVAAIMPTKISTVEVKIFFIRERKWKLET